MSSKVVRDAAESYIKANWATTAITAEENLFDDPPANLDPWLTYTFNSIGERRISIGSGKSCYEEEGEIVVTVFVASGKGTSDALTYAESARTMMRGFSPVAGLRVTEVDPPETAFPSMVQSSEGNFFGYQVVARYTYNYSV